MVPNLPWFWRQFGHVNAEVLLYLHAAQIELPHNYTQTADDSVGLASVVEGPWLPKCTCECFTTFSTV